MTKKTYDRLFWNAINRVKEQCSLIIDATFSSRQHRDELRQQLGTLGVAYCFIEAQASEEAIRRRLMTREGKLNEASDARLEDFEALTRSYEAPSEIGAGYLIAVGTERPFQTTVVEALKALSQRISREPKNEERPDRYNCGRAETDVGPMELRKRCSSSRLTVDL